MIAIADYDTGNLRSVANALRRVGAQFTVTSDPALLRRADKVVLPGVGEASSAMARLRERGLDTLIPTLTQPVLGICIGMQLMCLDSEEGNARCLGIFPAHVVQLGGGINRNGIADTAAANRAAGTYGKAGTAAAAEATGMAGMAGMTGMAGMAGMTGMTIPAKTAGTAETTMPENTAASPAGLIASTGVSPLKIPHVGWNTIDGLRGPLFEGLGDGTHVYYVHSYAAQLCDATVARTDYGGAFSAALRRGNFFGTQFHPEKSGTAGERILHNFLNL